MRNALWALLIIHVGCTQSTFYAGPAPLPTQATTVCPSFTGTTTVSWARPAAWAHAKLGISKDGRAPFSPVLDETKVPSGYFGRIIDASGQPLPSTSARCTEARTQLYIPDCKDSTIRVVDQEGRGLSNISVSHPYYPEYYRYGRTDPDGYFSACFFEERWIQPHGQGVLFDRREGQTFIMRPTQHQTVRVVDEEGRPLSKVEVAAFRFRRPSLLLKTWSNDEGLVEFEIGPAPWTEVTIHFSRRGYATHRYSPTDGGEVVLKRARIVLIPRSDAKGAIPIGREIRCGNFEQRDTFKCYHDTTDWWTCECPIGPANIFIDYSSFTIAAEATAVTVDLSTARNGIRGKVRNWQQDCELWSRRERGAGKVFVRPDGSFAHPAVAPSLKHWLKLECPNGNRRIEHDRLRWQWLDLGEI